MDDAVLHQLEKNLTAYWYYCYSYLLGLYINILISIRILIVSASFTEIYFSLLIIILKISLQK